MKPSERIKQIFKEYKSHQPILNTEIELRLANQALIDYLDEFDMELRKGDGAQGKTNLVDLLREIENQKFLHGNYCANRTRELLRQKFREVFPICEANAGLEEKVFGNDNG